MSIQAHVSAENDGFGQRLKEAIRKKLEPARKAKEKEQERWREAEHRRQPRPPAKSD
jgi:hypothetical protein